MTARKSTLYNIVSGFGVRSEHHIDVLNAKSVGSAIYRKDNFFLGSSNEAQKKPPEVFYKKAILKNSTIFTGKHLCRSLFSSVLESLQLY